MTTTRFALPCAAALAALAALATPAVARAQTLTEQEHRLMEVHSLLLDLPPVQAPAALPPGSLDLSLEAVTVPFIDGNAGPYHDITASARSRVYPRPRAMLGLPAPGGLRAYVGISYVPPVEFRQVRIHYAAGEAGVGLTRGWLLLGARVHAVGVNVRAPVTDPSTIDVLRTFEWGADATAGVRLGDRALQLQPYGGLGVVTFHSHFHVEVDGTNLTRDRTSAVLLGGLRLVMGRRWEAVAELASYPGRLTHADVRLGYRFGG